MAWSHDYHARHLKAQLKLVPNRTKHRPHAVVSAVATTKVWYGMVHGMSTVAITMAWCSIVWFGIMRHGTELNVVELK